MKLLAVAAFSAFFASQAALSGSASPVEQVVKLLEELKERLTADEKTEQEIYDKYACWCESSTAKKAANIATARTDLQTGGQNILTLKGTAATLAAEIATLLTDMKANEQAQQTATSIRQTESESYLAESAELKQALEATEKALSVLKDAAVASAFLQSRSGDNDGSSEQAILSLRHVVAALPQRTRINSTKLTLLRRAALGGKAGYSPQSASITGILEQIYNDFSTDLQAKINAESTSSRAYEGLMATKHAELKAMKDQVASKEASKAEASVSLAEAIQLYDDTERQMHADIAFFDSTKAACEAKSNEWSQRSALRADEIQGIQDALAILTSDDARALFINTIKPGYATLFLQIGSIEHAGAVPAKRHAYEALKAKAKKVHSLRLAKLAASVSLATAGNFDNVIAAIDLMIGTLQSEESDDISKRDQCIDEYKNINSTVGDLNWKIEVNQAKIEKLEALIEAKEKEKAETIDAIADVIQQKQDMTTQRAEENQAYQQAKLEDQQAIALLVQARTALNAYYVENSINITAGLNLLQQGPDFERSPDQAPDANFTALDHRAGESKGIVGILTMLIQDLGGEIAVLDRDEASALMAYNESMNASNTLHNELETKKTNLETTIAEKQGLKQDESDLKTANEADLTAEEQYRTQITPDCDWIIGAFDKRRSHRKAEMDGLVQAKEFLAGAQAG